MRNSRFKNNIAKQRKSRRVFNLLKRKFWKESEPELTVDDYDQPQQFVKQDEWDRHERHMFPIREAQKHNDS